MKRKNKGRIDLFDRFPSIRDEWLKAYFNKQKIAGMSVNQVVNAEDEWCAEAYMETDYSTLADDDFTRELRKYTASQIVKGIL